MSMDLSQYKPEGDKKNSSFSGIIYNGFTSGELKKDWIS